MEGLKRSIEAVVREAGDRLLHAGTAQVTAKAGIGNYVTDQDVATQRFLYARLGALLPGASFLGEEDASHDESVVAERFIIDPIDGTANYMRGAGYSAISVAFAKNGRPRIGVVYNPWTNELYSAETGCGAFLNGAPIRVSERALSEAIAVVGFTSYARDFTERQFRLFRRLFDHCQDLRSLGSAALDICGVAAGRWEVFTELRLMPWDYAAAMCILEEAGGRLTRVDGETVGFNGETPVLAACAACYEEVLTLCR